MAWCRQTISHYLRHCWPKYMLLHCVPRPQWVNEERCNLDWHHNFVKHRLMEIGWSLKDVLSKDSPQPMYKVMSGYCKTETSKFKAEKCCQCPFYTGQRFNWKWYQTSYLLNPDILDLDKFMTSRDPNRNAPTLHTIRKCHLVWRHINILCPANRWPEAKGPLDHVTKIKCTVEPLI